MIQETVTWVSGEQLSVLVQEEKRGQLLRQPHTNLMLQSGVPHGGNQLSKSDKPSQNLQKTPACLNGQLYSKHPLMLRRSPSSSRTKPYAVSRIHNV